MASYITYKTIIHKAISDFNAIQDALATVGAKYNAAGMATTSSTGAVLVPTGDVGPVITEQLQLKASGTKENPSVAADGTIDLKITDYTSYRYVKLTLGSATTPATTITPADMTSSFANGKLTVSLAQKTQSVTPTVSAGYITAGTAGTITVAAKTFDIPQLTSFKWTGATLKAGGNGYVITDQILATMSNATIAAEGSKTISVTNGLKLVTSDDSSKGGVNVYNDVLSLTEDTTAASGYSNVSTSEPTSGNYIAFTAKSTGGSTTATTSVSASGYATAGSTYSTSVSTNGHADVTYYYPVKDASATISGNKNASTPTIAASTASVSGKTRITNGTLGTSVGSDAYYLAMKATAPATSISLTPTVKTKGYLSAASQITGSASTNATSSGDYYYSIPKATFSVDGNAIKASTAGYIGAGDSVANVSAGSLAYTSTITSSYTDVDGKGEWGTTDPTSIFVSSLTDAQKAKDYYTITATGSGNLTAGYIGSNPTAATKTMYMPKATLAYVTDSNKNKIIEVKTAGFLPAGILHDIGEISGTLDTAELTIDLGNTPTYSSTNNNFTLTATLGVTSAGYVDSSANVSKTVAIARATYTGGGLSGATTSTLSISSGSDYTTSTGSKAIVVKASNQTISKAAVTVSTAGYDAAGNTVSAASSATITGGTTTIRIKDGAIGNNSSTCSINNLDGTSAATNKGAAKIYSTAAKADSNNYVSVSAASSSSCSVTTAGWLDTQTKTGSGSATAYLKASVNPTVNYSSSASTASLSATQFSNNTTTSAVDISGGTNKTVTSSASASGLAIGDTYVIGSVGVNKTAENSATLPGDVSGSSVDSAFQSLYNRMLGYQYTDVSAD